MKKTIGRSGGSFIVTLPPRFIQSLGLRLGSSVSVVLRGSEIIIRSPQSDAKKLTRISTEALREELRRRGFTA